MPSPQDLAAVDTAARIAALIEWELVQITHDCQTLRALFNRPVEPWNRTTARNAVLQLTVTLRPFGWTPTAEDVAESPIVLQLEHAREVPRALALRFPTTK